jgi:hypothetical protein
MKPFFRSYFYTLMLSLFAVSICSSAFAGRNEDVYDSLYPYYAEVCALHAVERNANYVITDDGSTAGHSVAYIRGACKDPSVPYPRLKLCDSSVKDTDRRGVGISVNRFFKNANWTAVASRKLFFDGGGTHGRESFSGADYEGTVAAALREGVYKNLLLELTNEANRVKPPQMTTEEFVARESMGTDYAIRASRDSYCTYLPLTQDMTIHAINQLNALNDKYAVSKDYEWRVFSNNCAHLIHNALAAAGVWSPIGVDQFYPIQVLFDVAVPSNQFLNLLRIADNVPIDNIVDLYRNANTRRTLNEFGWLPTSDGIVVTSEPLTLPNDVFHRGRGLLFMSAIGIRDTKSYMSTARWTNLYQSVLDARNRLVSLRMNYQRPQLRGRIEKKKVGAEIRESVVYPMPPAELPAFEAKYLAFLDARVAELNKKLATLSH